MQLDAAPLETAFFQDVARPWIGDTRTCKELILIELLEEIIDRGTSRLGAKALVPMLEAEPIAELRRIAPVDAAHADRDKITLDQEGDVVSCCSRGAHEFDRMIL